MYSGLFASGLVRVSGQAGLEIDVVVVEIAAVTVTHGQKGKCNARKKGRNRHESFIAGGAEE
jgi:hypothetical protein